MSIQVLCPFLNWVIYLFVLGFVRVHYVFWILDLYLKYDLQITSPILWCFSTFFFFLNLHLRRVGIQHCVGYVSFRCAAPWCIISIPHTVMTPVILVTTRRHAAVSRHHSPSPVHPSLRLFPLVSLVCESVLVLFYLFIRFFRFHMSVKSHSICLSLPDLFHWA